MILGTGWPFGGARVSDDDRARKWHFEPRKAAAGEVVSLPARLGRPADGILVGAFARNTVRAAGTPVAVDLAAVRAGGAVRWQAPDQAGWEVVGVYLASTGQKVKRAGPGAEGWVLDHFNPDAIQRYLRGFDRFLDSLPSPGLRCVFNDSWEVYGADASAHLLKTFPAQAGEPWESLWPSLMPDTDAAPSNRVRRAYREHVDETIRTIFLGALVRWAAAHGIRVRNQAHGSPGNLIDIYAASDIPECELFQGAVLRLVGDEPLGGTKAGDEVQALEELLVCRMASAAAKLTGKPFASAEAFTWLGEHGRVQLSHKRTEAAKLFACGIGQLVFHGSMASPLDVPWPGWTFYASTHVSPATAWWDDLPILNQWIARNQERLQSGSPEADYLV
ncbi:MAG: glycosyl hydrolase, partial [Armatimonadaceae bacterium]